MEITSGKIRTAQKVVLYGPEGIGKSTFASQFPDPLFTDTEGSTKHLEVNRLPVPSSWTMLLQQIAWVKANPSSCRTYVVDTADWAEKLCIAHICSKKEGIDGIEDFGYGKGYTYLEEEFGRFLNALSDIIEIGIHVLLTAHAEIRKFEEPDEMGAYDRWQLKLQKKTAALVKEWADMLLFANYKTEVVNVDNQGATKGKNKAQGGRRVIYASHTPSWDAKNRHGLEDMLPSLDFQHIADHIPTITPQTPVAAPVPPTQTESPSAPAQVATQPMQTIVYGQDGSVISATKNEVSKGQFTEEQPSHLKPLYDLMKADGINIVQVCDAVASRPEAVYTIETPIENYDPDYVSGVLVAAWDQVKEIIKSREPYTEELPFK